MKPRSTTRWRSYMARPGNVIEVPEQERTISASRRLPPARRFEEGPMGVAEATRVAANTEALKLYRARRRFAPISASLLVGTLLFSTALSLNLYRLGNPGIWYDEAFSVELSRLPLPMVWRIIFGREPNMEFYYLFLHAWLRLTSLFGLAPTEFVVRFPSALFAALSTVFVFLIGRRFISLS